MRQREGEEPGRSEGEGPERSEVEENLKTEPLTEKQLNQVSLAADTFGMETVGRWETTHFSVNLNSFLHMYFDETILVQSPLGPIKVS